MAKVRIPKSSGQYQSNFYARPVSSVSGKVDARPNILHVDMNWRKTADVKVSTKDFQSFAAMCQRAQASFLKLHASEVKRHLGQYFGMVMASHFISQTDSAGRRWKSLAPATLRRKQTVFFRNANGRTSPIARVIGKINADRSANSNIAGTGFEVLSRNRLKSGASQQMQRMLGTSGARKTTNTQMHTVFKHLPSTKKQVEKFTEITKTERMSRGDFRTRTSYIIPLVESGVMFKASTGYTSYPVKDAIPPALGLSVGFLQDSFTLNAIMPPGQEGKFLAHNRRVGSKPAMAGPDRKVKIPGREFFYLTREDVAFFEQVLMAEALYDKDYFAEVTSFGAFSRATPSPARRAKAAKPNFWGAMTFAAMSHGPEQDKARIVNFFTSMIHQRTRDILESTGAKDMITAADGAARAYKKRRGGKLRIYANG